MSVLLSAKTVETLIFFNGGQVSEKTLFLGIDPGAAGGFGIVDGKGGFVASGADVGGCMVRWATCPHPDGQNWDEFNGSWQAGVRTLPLSPGDLSLLERGRDHRDRT
jgi:hypothetical protein